MYSRSRTHKQIERIVKFAPRKTDETFNSEEISKTRNKTHAQTHTEKKTFAVHKLVGENHSITNETQSDSLMLIEVVNIYGENEAGKNKRETENVL